MPKGPIDKKNEQFMDPTRFDLGGDFKRILPSELEFQGTLPGRPVESRYAKTMPPLPEGMGTDEYESIYDQPPPSFDAIQRLAPEADVGLPAPSLRDWGTLAAKALAPGLDLPGMAAGAEVIAGVAKEAVQPLVNQYFESRRERQKEELSRARGLAAELTFEQASEKERFESGMKEYYETYGHIGGNIPGTPEDIEKWEKYASKEQKQVYGTPLFVPPTSLAERLKAKHGIDPGKPGAKRYSFAELRDPYKTPDEMLAFSASSLLASEAMSYFSESADFYAIERKVSERTYDPDSEAKKQSKLAIQNIFNNNPAEKEKAVLHLWNRIKARYEVLKQPGNNDTENQRKEAELRDLQPFYRLLGDKNVNKESERRTLLKEVNAGEQPFEPPASAREVETRGRNLEAVQAERRKRQEEGLRAAVTATGAYAEDVLGPEKPSERTDPSVTVTIRPESPYAFLAEFFVGPEAVTYGREKTIPVADLSDSQLDELAERLSKEQMEAVHRVATDVYRDAANRLSIAVKPPETATAEEYALLASDTIPPERWLLPLLASVYSHSKKQFHKLWDESTEHYNALYEDPDNAEAQNGLLKIIRDATSSVKGKDTKTFGYVTAQPEKYKDKLEGIFRFFVPMPMSWFRENGEPWVYNYNGTMLPIYPVEDSVYADLVDAVQEGKPETLRLVRALNPQDMAYLSERKKLFMKQMLLTSGLYGNRETYGWFTEMLGQSSIFASFRWSSITKEGGDKDLMNMTPTQMMLWWKNNQIDVSDSATLHAAWLRDIVRTMEKRGTGLPMYISIPKHWMRSIGDLGLTAAKGITAMIYHGVPWAVGVVETGAKYAAVGAAAGSGIPVISEIAKEKGIPAVEEEFAREFRAAREITVEMSLATLDYLADYMEPGVAKRRFMMDLPWVVGDVLMVWGASLGITRLAGKGLSLTGKTGKLAQLYIAKRAWPYKYNPDQVRLIRAHAKHPSDPAIPELPSTPSGTRHVPRPGHQAHFDHLRKPGPPQPAGIGVWNKIIEYGESFEFLKRIGPEALIKKVRDIPRTLARRGDAIGKLASTVTVTGDWSDGVNIIVENQSGKQIIRHILSAESANEAINAIVKHMLTDGHGSPELIAHARREFTKLLSTVSREGDFATTVLYEFSYHPLAKPMPRYRVIEISPHARRPARPAPHVAHPALPAAPAGRRPLPSPPKPHRPERYEAQAQPPKYAIEDVKTREVIGEYDTAAQAKRTLEEGTFIDKSGSTINPLEEMLPYDIPEGIQLERVGEGAEGYQVIERLTGKRVLASRNIDEIHNFLKEKGDTLLAEPEKKYKTLKATFLDPKDVEFRIVDKAGKVLETFPNEEAAYQRLREIGYDSPSKFQVTGEELARALNSEEALDLVQQLYLAASKRKNFKLIKNPTNPENGVLGYTIPIMDIDGVTHHLDGVKLGLLRPRGKTYEMSPMSQMLIRDSALSSAGFEYVLTPSLNGAEHIRFLLEALDLNSDGVVVLGKYDLVVHKRPLRRPKDVGAVAPAQKELPEITPAKVKATTSEGAISEVASMDFDEAVALIGTKLDADEAYVQVLEPQASAIVRRLGTRNLQKIADFYADQLGVYIEVKEALPHDLATMEVTIRPPKRRAVPPGTDPTSLDAWEITIPLQRRVKVIGEVAGKPRYVQYAPGKLHLEVTPHARHEKLPAGLVPEKQKLTPALRRSAKGLQQKIRSKLFKKKKELKAKLAEVEGMVIRPRKTEKRTEAALRKKLDSEQKLRDEIAEVEAGIEESQKIIDLATPGGLEVEQRFGQVKQTAYIPRGNFDVSVLRQAIGQLETHLTRPETKARLRIPFVLKDDTVYLGTSPEIQQSGLVRDAAFSKTIKGSKGAVAKKLRDAGVDRNPPRVQAKHTRRPKKVDPKQPKPAPIPEYLLTFEEWVEAQIKKEKKADIRKKLQKRKKKDWNKEYRKVVKKAMDEGRYVEALKPNKSGVALADKDLVGQVIQSANYDIPDNLDIFYWGLKEGGGPIDHKLQHMHVNQIVGETEVFVPEALPIGMGAVGEAGGKVPLAVVQLNWLAKEFGYTQKKGIAIFEFLVGNDGHLVATPDKVKQLIAEIMGEKISFESKSMGKGNLTVNWDEAALPQLERDSQGFGIAILKDKDGNVVTGDVWNQKYSAWKSKAAAEDSGLMKQYLNRVDYIDVKETTIGKLFSQVSEDYRGVMADKAANILTTDKMKTGFPSLGFRNWFTSRWKELHKSPIQMVKMAYQDLSAESLTAWDVWRRGVGDIPPIAEIYGFGDDWVRAGLAEPVLDASGKVITYNPTPLGVVSALYNIGKRHEFYKNIPFRALTGDAARGLAPQLRIDFRRIIEGINQETGQPYLPVGTPMAKAVKSVLTELNQIERGQKWLSDPILAYQNAVLSFAGDAGMFPTDNAMLNAIEYFRNLWDGAFDSYAAKASSRQAGGESALMRRKTKGYTQREVDHIEQFTGNFRTNLDPEMFVGWVMAELESRINFANLIEKLIDEGMIRTATQEIMDVRAGVVEKTIKGQKKVSPGKVIETAGGGIPVGPGIGYEPLDLSSFFDKMTRRRVLVEEGARAAGPDIVLQGLESKYGQLYGTAQVRNLLELEINNVSKLRRHADESVQAINPINDIFYDGMGNLRPKKEAIIRAVEAMGEDIEPYIRDVYTDVALKSGKKVPINVAARKMISLIVGAGRENSLFASIFEKLARGSEKLNKTWIQRLYKTNALFRSSIRGSVRNFNANLAMALAHHPEAFIDPVYWEGAAYFWGGKPKVLGGKGLPLSERWKVVPEGVGGIGPRKVTEKVKAKEGVVEVEFVREHPLPPDVQEFQRELIARNIIGNGPSWEVREEVPGLQRSYYNNERTRGFRDIMSDSAWDLERKAAKLVDETLGVELSIDHSIDLMNAFGSQEGLRRYVAEALAAGESQSKITQFLRGRRGSWKRKAYEAGVTDPRSAYEFPFNTKAGKKLEHFVKSTFVVTDDMHRWNYAYWLWKRKKLSFDEITRKVGEFMPDFARNSAMMHTMRLGNPWAFWPVKTARNLMLLAARRPVYSGVMRMMSVWMDALEMSELSPEEQWAYLLRPARERSWLLRLPMGDYAFSYGFYTGDLDTIFDPYSALDIGATGMAVDLAEIIGKTMFPKKLGEKFEPRFGSPQDIGGLADAGGLVFANYWNNYAPRLGFQPHMAAWNAGREYVNRFKTDGGDAQFEIWDNESKASALKDELRFLFSSATKDHVGAIWQDVHRWLGDVVKDDVLAAVGRLESGIFYKEGRGSRDEIRGIDLLMKEIGGFDPANRDKILQQLYSLSKRHGGIREAVNYIYSRRPGVVGKERLSRADKIARSVEYVKEKGVKYGETSTNIESVIKQILPARTKDFKWARVMPVIKSVIGPSPANKAAVVKVLAERMKEDPGPELEILLNMVLGMKIQGVPTEKGETQ